MAAKTQVAEGEDLDKLKALIKSNVNKINRAVDRRGAINEEIASAKANLAEKGIPKKCLNMALAYANMDPDDREGFDIAYDLVREAIELPVNAQGSIFDVIKKRKEAEAESEETRSSH